MTKPLILLAFGAALFIAAAWNAQAVVAAYVHLYSGPNAYRIPQIVWGVIGGGCLLISLCVLVRKWPKKYVRDETDEAGA